MIYITYEEDDFLVGKKVKNVWESKTDDVLPRYKKFITQTAK